MAKNIWLISDTHFCHKNILTFKDNDGNLIRGARFSTVEEMDDHMVERWNSVVSPGDLVYHLGDVTIGDKDRFKTLWPRLVGSKRLVVGNHDDIPWLSSGGFFKKTMMWRQFPEFGLLLTHVPLHESGLWDYRNKRELLNVHGHIHHHASPTERHINMSVEAINYTPVNIEEIRRY